MKVLITGGAGFIGAHVAKALVDRGDEVVLFDDFTSLVYPAEVKQARLDHFFPRDSRPRLIIGNVLDAKLLDTVFSEEEFDKVLHLAAHANPAVSIQAAEEYALVNVMGTLAVLQAASRYDITQFVFASSSSVYNDAQTPFREDHYPLRPLSPYGASKAAAEVFCTMWHELQGLPITMLRYFSVYGPWGRPDMAPSIFAQKIVEGQPVEITQDRQRDFTYIDDVVDATIAAIDRQFDCEIINIGRGQPLELEKLVEALENAAGGKAQRRVRQSPPGEMRITYADISKAKQLLGYEPKVSVEEGAEKLIAWMKTQEQ